MKQFIKYAIVLVATTAVVYPLWTRLQNLQFQLGPDYTASLFPFFGILAFTLLWLHSMMGVFEPWLRKYVDFDRFVHITANIILVSLLAHPLLLLLTFNFDISNIFMVYSATSVRLGIIGLILLLTYDIAKPFKRNNNFFARNWENVLTISTIGFLITFFHSLNLGSDLQTGPLRVLWIFYGVTAILGTIYTYGVKRFLLKK